MTAAISQHDTALDHIRTLLIMKNHIRSERFRSLVEHVHDPALAGVLARMSQAAEEDERALERVVHEWQRSPPREPRLGTGTPLELVQTWSHVQELSAVRLREAAAQAPDATIRSSLEAMASRDNAYARMLRSLL